MMCTMHWSAFRNFVPSAIGRSWGWGVDCWRGAKRRKPTLIVLSSHRCCTKMQSHEWSPPWWWWWWWPPWWWWWLGWWLWWHSMHNMHMTAYHLNWLWIVEDCQIADWGMILDAENNWDKIIRGQLISAMMRMTKEYNDDNQVLSGENWYRLCDDNMMTKIFVKFFGKLR